MSPPHQPVKKFFLEPDPQQAQAVQQEHPARENNENDQTDKNIFSHFNSRRDCDNPDPQN